MKYFISQIFQSKAFGFLALLFVLGTVLLVLGKLASHEWLSLMQWLGTGAVARSAIGDFSTQRTEIESTKHEVAKNIAADTDAAIQQRIVDSTK
jgi:hypothetical protein